MRKYKQEADILDGKNAIQSNEYRLLCDDYKSKCNELLELQYQLDSIKQNISKTLDFNQALSEEIDQQIDYVREIKNQ